MEIRTKYNMDDLVWFMQDNRTVQGKIIGITTRMDNDLYYLDKKYYSRVEYKVDYGCYTYDRIDLRENLLYLSKQALIATL